MVELIAAKFLHASNSIKLPFSGSSSSEKCLTRSPNTTQNSRIIKKIPQSSLFSLIIIDRNFSPSTSSRFLKIFSSRFDRCAQLTFKGRSTSCGSTPRSKSNYTIFEEKERQIRWRWPRIQEMLEFFQTIERPSKGRIRWGDVRSSIECRL